MPTRTRKLVRILAFGGIAAFACHAPVRAADVQLTLPTLTAPPGASVVVPIESNTGPAGLGIQSVEFRMDFAPGVIAASASRPDGWVRAWGPAFVNANASFVAVAAAGFPAIADGGTRLNTLELTVSPSAVPGTDMPLTLQHVLCNEGTPSVEVVPGLLRVRTTAAVEPGVASAFALSAPAPNPAARAARFTLTLPAGSGRPVRLAVFGVDGRLVRELANGALAAGRHDFSWDTRDDAGMLVRPGLYFARATFGGVRLQRRLAVAR